MKFQKNLFTYISAGNIEAIKSLVNDNPQLVNFSDNLGISAVLYSYYTQNPDIGDYLIENGANVGIFEASAGGKIEQLQEILEMNPDCVNEYSADGFQALGYSCFFGHMAAVRILIKSGASVNSFSQNELKVMPLHSAVANQNLEIVCMLIENGADLNTVQNGGFTALHSAAYNGQIEMVKLLIEAGANPKTKNNENKTPENLAEDMGHKHVVEFFKQHDKANSNQSDTLSEIR
jgi:ankyrin repeat protein